MSRVLAWVLVAGAVLLPVAGTARADGLSRLASNGTTGRVVTTTTTCTVLDNVEFVGATAVIARTSGPILEAIADTLKGNPSITLVEIQGHTDERGDEAANLDLSDRRARAVRANLIARGVSPDRLEAQGYGETQPLDLHHTAAAWRKNRRVAFLILKRETD